MQNINKKCAKTVLTAILAIVLMIPGLMTWEGAYARENKGVPDLKQDKSNFTLEVVYTDDEEKTAVDGIKLAIYKVAKVTVSNGNAKYSATSDFKDAGFKFNDMTASDSLVYADKAAAIVAQKDLKGKTVTTDKNGCASFGAVENGIYLVIQTGASGTAEKFGKLSPWLMEVPELVEHADGSKSWEYDVKALPKPIVGKTEKEEPRKDAPPEELDGGTTKKEDRQETENPEDTTYKTEKEKTPFEKILVRTGDENNVLIFSGLAILAIGLLVLVIAKRHHN